jgi:hypothetical protein
LAEINPVKVEPEGTDAIETQFELIAKSQQSFAV